MLLVAVATLAMQAAPPPPSISKPSPRGRPETWITDDDYPASALRNHQSGPVKVRIDVDARGRPVGCHITGSSGYAALDEKACEILGKRSDFSPARDTAGQNVPFAYDSTFTWSIPGSVFGPNPVSETAGTAVDVVINLKSVPKSYAKPALLRLVFAGATVKACKVELTSGNLKLDAVACAQVATQVPPLPSIKGWPDADSRMVAVRFEASQ